MKATSILLVLAVAASSYALAIPAALPNTNADQQVGTTEVSLRTKQLFARSCVPSYCSSLWECGYGCEDCNGNVCVGAPTPPLTPSPPSTPGSSPPPSPGSSPPTSPENNYGSSLRSSLQSKHGSKGKGDGKGKGKGKGQI